MRRARGAYLGEFEGFFLECSAAEAGGDGGCSLDCVVAGGRLVVVGCYEGEEDDTPEGFILGHEDAEDLRRW